MRMKSSHYEIYVALQPRWTATEGVLALIATPGGLRLTHNATGGLALIVTPGGLQLKVYWLSSRPQVNSD